MPFCPVCQAEYREGFKRCSTCDVDLVERLEEQHHFSEEEMRQALSGKELVVISRGPFDAVMELRDNLRSQRLPALVMEDPEQPKEPGVPKRMDLLVRKIDLDAAASVLGESFKELMQREGLEAKTEMKFELCPACGSQVPEKAEECPECGLFVGKGDQQQ
jgi:hypothetical protein